MYLVKNYQGKMQLIIKPEFEMTRTGTLAEDITANSQRIVRYLESLIRRYPDQWNWLTVRLRVSQRQLPRRWVRGRKRGEEGRTPDLMLGKDRRRKNLKPA
jgi:lauroyl/myristoyl acyltransferase